MFRKKGTTVCPNDPYLAKRGLKGRKMATFEEGLLYAQEQYLWMLNVNAVLIGCRKQITPDNVRVALRKLCQRHPNLRVGITTGETAKDRYLKFFETDPEPDLEVLDTDDWVATVEQQFTQTFDNDGLQWRVKMLKATKDPDTERWRHPFVFNYNHAVVDGGSIIAGIFTNFHRYLEDAVVGRDTEVESLDFLPGREAMFPQMIPSIFDRMYYKVKELFQGSLMTSDPMAGELQKCLSPDKDAQIVCTKLIPMDLTVEETGKIVQKCREHGIKVNGYTSAAAAIATGNLLRRHTKNPNLPKELTFDLPFMLNMRRFADPPIMPEQVGFLVSIIHMAITVADDGSNTDAFWELAKKCNSYVHETVAGDEPVESAKLFNYLFESKDYGSLFKSFAEVECPFFTYYITNRGNFEIKSQYPDDEGSCTFEGNYWSCSDHKFNFDMFVQNLQSVNGHLMWTLTYYGHKCSDETAKEYLADIKDILLRMSE